MERRGRFVNTYLVNFFAVSTATARRQDVPHIWILLYLVVKYEFLLPRIWASITAF